MSPEALPTPSAPESARWGGVYAAATAGLGLATAAGFFWPVARAGLSASALLVIIAGIAAGSGRVAAGFLGLRGPEEGAKTVVGMTLGLGLLSLSVLALAALGLLRTWTLSLMLAAFWLAGFSELRAALRGCRLPEQWRSRPLAAAGILAALGLTFWLTWVPPHQYDSLVYHLALPAAYLRAGGLTVEGLPVFAHFPQNGEMLFVLALALKSDLLAQMFMWLAAALSVAWLWTMAGAEIAAEARLLAALLLATHTAVMLLASTTYIDPLVMLWTTAAVLLFWRWRRESAGAPRSWLALSAIFAGLALGAKYTAGITAGSLGLFLVKDWLWGPPATRRARAGDLAVFVGVVTVVFSPWLVKNALQAGDPVFPFLYQWFPATQAGWPAAGAARYFAVLTEYGHGGAWAQALLALPGQLLGNSLRFGGGMDVLGDMGWELLFWALPLAVWAGWRRRNRTALWLLAFCGLYLAAWFSTGVVLRFLTALAPLLCLLAAYGLHALWSRLESGGRVMLAAGAGLLVATHVLVFLYAHAVFGSGRVLAGLESREEFLTSRLEYYPCAAWAREHLGGNDRILIVGEQRAYYWTQDNTATTVNAPNRYRAWADDSASPAAYAARLRAAGFSHVAVIPREARRLAPALESFNERGARNWLGLESGFVEPVFQGPACAIYRLR
ncbi:MAG: phospholipid carrier-dependent glycosyltransferase [Elusimicrobia bacterium]|nr:phospholipid carrier-dependent glycosyltransferase [Elusimicrobiota bacterium]